jgi:hypothetical protein
MLYHRHLQDEPGVAVFYTVYDSIPAGNIFSCGVVGVVFTTWMLGNYLHNLWFYEIHLGEIWWFLKCCVVVIVAPG